MFDWNKIKNSLNGLMLPGYNAYREKSEKTITLEGQKLH